jgi:hypothetical protein
MSPAHAPTTPPADVPVADGRRAALGTDQFDSTPESTIDVIFLPGIHVLAFTLDEPANRSRLADGTMGSSPRLGIACSLAELAGVVAQQVKCANTGTPSAAASRPA